MKKIISIILISLCINSCKVEKYIPYQHKFSENIRNTNNDYINIWSPIIIYYCLEENIPYDVPIAIAILESNYGKSNFVRNKHNHFGIMSNGKGTYFQNDTACIIYSVKLLKQAYYNPKTNRYTMTKYCPTDRNYGKKLRNIIEDNDLDSMINNIKPLNTKIKYKKEII